MVHFLRQLQAFYQLEVVECSWSVLEDFIEKRTGDLDALIHAHRIYLERLTRKVLLSGGKRDKEVRSLFPVAGYPSRVSADEQEVLLNLVLEALEYILHFRSAIVRPLAEPTLHSSLFPLTGVG